MVASGRTLLLLQILPATIGPSVHGLDEYVNRAQSAVDLQIPLLPSEENVFPAMLIPSANAVAGSLPVRELGMARRVQETGAPRWSEGTRGGQAKPETIPPAAEIAGPMGRRTVVGGSESEH